MPPFSVLCGISKIASSGEDFIANAGKSGTQLLEEQKKADALIDSFKQKVNNLQNVPNNMANKMNKK